MTTSANTTKQEEFFNSLYTPEEMEHHTLAKVKDEILNIMDDDDVQWEIKRLGSGRRILKMITTADFWSGTWLGEVETICRSMSLTWWMSDCRVFNNEILPYSKVALNVSTLKLACNQTLTTMTTATKDNNLAYKNNREHKTEAQFQIGWKGFIQLAIRSGQFQAINATDIRDGELKGYDLMTGEVNVQAVPDRENKPVIGYLAYFKLTNGFAKSLYMTAEEIEQHATRYSQSYRGKYKDSSLWATDKDAMAKKTVLKLLLNRFAPLSVGMQRAVQADQSVLHGDGKLEYVDNNLAYRLALVSNAIYDYFREYDQEVHCHTTYVGKKLFGLQVNKALGACWYDRELRKIDEICKPLDFAFKIRLKSDTQGKWHTTNIAVLISPYLIR